jgi:hypothetical protein
MGLLSFRPAPGEDELLTSYLVRTAHLHGWNAFRFFSYHLPTIAIWNRDFDRTASATSLAEITKLYGLPDGAAMEMTLTPYVRNICDESRSQGHSTLPWINTVGVYHRIRRRHGLQFCPECLEEEPFFKRLWRLSFVVACHKHKQILLDGCVNCGAPVIPHRANISPLSCHHCGAWLYKAPVIRKESGFNEAVSAQQTLLAAAAVGRISWSSLEVSSGQFFLGLRTLLRLARNRCRHRPTEVPELQWLPPYRFEMMRTYDRFGVMSMLGRHLMPDSESLAAFLDRLGVTQGHFIALGPIPDWLSVPVSALPRGQRRRSSLPDTLEQRLAKERRERAQGWRSRHAQLLMQLTESDHEH